MDMGTLILVHLVGDYVYQNDWMAQNKSARTWEGTAACLVHVTLYTLMFVCFTWVMGDVWPWWAYAAIWATHYPVDRYRLAAAWMGKAGQTGFRDNMGPWSVIIVDNTYHLLCAWTIWRLVLSAG